MIFLNDLLWILIIFCAVIGVFRGAAKELRVGGSVLVALFFLQLFETFGGFVIDILQRFAKGNALFILQTVTLGLLVLAGYQVPGGEGSRIKFKARLSDKDLVEKVLGAILGAVNGFLIFGTLWYFMDQAGYPPEYFFPPPMDGERGEAVRKLLEMLPPNWLEAPAIYFAVAIFIGVVLVILI